MIRLRALHIVVRDLMSTRDGATYLARRVWGISTGYDLGGGHPLAGHSVPNSGFEDGATIGELMYDGQRPGLQRTPEGCRSLVFLQFMKSGSECTFLNIRPIDSALEP